MVKLSAGFCIGMAAMILLLPLPWLAAAILAAAFHELCHCTAIRLLSGKGGRLNLGLGGGAMELPALSPYKELICTLAGPLGGICLLLLARWMPRTALCGAFQSLYNLLPIYPLDGGRALSCLARMALPPPKAGFLCGCVENLTLAGLLLLGIYGFCVLRLGLLPLLLAGFLILRVKYAKK